MEKLYHVTGIEWDTDGESADELGLSESHYVFTCDEESIADILSDETGYCVKSFDHIRECGDSDDGLLFS